MKSSTPQKPHFDAQAGTIGEQDSLAALGQENARLVALLESHGIAWRLPPEPTPSVPESDPSHFSAETKVALFRRLFRGRTDVYPVRWESKSTGKSGYAPACANEWRPGVCDKPRIKCGDCGNRRLSPLSDSVIYGHLLGKHTVGVYSLLEDDTCTFLAVDFDEAEWQERCSRLRAFLRSTRRPDGPGDFAFRAGCTCLGVFRKQGRSTGCPSSGHGHHQPYLRAHPATEAEFL